MKQLLQNLRNGEVLLEEVACPSVRPGSLLIRTTRSLISAGTERMFVEFGRSGYLGKAKQQPEKVRQVIDKIRTDGLASTYHAVMSKLDQPMPLGYCNVGRVVEVGSGAKGFQVGDRIVSNGPHAEVVCVPANLCVKIPEEVADDEAAFAVVSAIGLQGVRLLNPTLCEAICVFGLGLIGLVAVQLLKANGARVLGFDYDADRVALARSFGIEAVDLSTGADPVVAGRRFSRDRGVDGVLVTASTQSNDLMHQAAQMSRKRGRIVLTGVAGLQLNRSDFYEKELTFQVSCSYGPGRYDPAYEEQGHDYPVGFVRWTVNRNLESVLDLLRDRAIDVGRLVSRRVKFEDAPQAYDALVGVSDIGILLEYSQEEQDDSRLRRRVVETACHRDQQANLVVGVIGAGSFASQVLLPVLRRSPARMKWIASSKGVSGAHAARKFRFENSTTDYRQILDDPDVNAVFVTTRHQSHAAILLDCLKAGMNVFVEKPLCTKLEELDRVVSDYEKATRGPSCPLVMVGFNRRFSPLTRLIKERTEARSTPLSLSFTCNAGAVPAEHWTQDAEIGGGRIVGEACHFVDLLQFVAGCPVTRVAAMKQGVKEANDLEDNVAIILEFADGSVGHVNYFSTGSRRYPKERLEVFFEGRTLCLNNFRELRAYGFAGFSRKRLRKQDKGHAAGFRAFLEAVRQGAESPTPFESLVSTTRVMFRALDSMRTGEMVLL